MTIFYRVTWVDENWPSLGGSQQFHPLHVPIDRQGQGRFDNPHLYAAIYASTTAQGAIGETFGNYSRWLPAEITRQVDGRARCLVTIEVPDTVVLRDLDDPHVLLDLGLRPTDIVRRDRDHTQEVANAVWQRRADSGVRGFSWWSGWRPVWTMVAMWSDGLAHPYFPDMSVVDVEMLTMTLPAVQVAADVLPRELVH